MSGETPGIDADLDKLQRDTFGYFLHETNPANGLVIDKTAEDWPASIAAIGLALAVYPVGVERGFISRSAAVERTLTPCWQKGPDATGYHGFYYHFLDMQTGLAPADQLQMIEERRNSSPMSPILKLSDSIQEINDSLLNAVDFSSRGAVQVRRIELRLGVSA